MRPVIDIKIFYPDRSFIERKDIAFILDHIAKDRGVNPDDVRKKSRKRYMADTRQLVSAVAYKVCCASLWEVATFIGYKDHTSVSHAIELCGDVSELQNLYERYVKELA